MENNVFHTISQENFYEIKLGFCLVILFTFLQSRAISIMEIYIELSVSYQKRFEGVRMKVY